MDFFKTKINSDFFKKLFFHVSENGARPSKQKKVFKHQIHLKSLKMSSGILVYYTPLISELAIVGNWKMPIDFGYV